MPITEEMGLSENSHSYTWESAVELLRRDRSQAKLVEAAYYDDPIDVAAKRYQQSEEWKAILPYFPAGNLLSVLDIGAGRGIASYALAKEGHRVTALEPDQSHVVGAAAIRKLADLTNVEIEVVEESANPLPFESNSFDLIFARAVLHHIEDLETACADFYRILKPGGRIIAVREHVLSKADDLQAFLDSHPLHQYYGGEHAYLLEEYRNALSGAGFRLTNTICPFESCINYGPSSLADVQQALADRIANSGLRRDIALWIISQPLCWRLIQPALDKIDQRPGRLYSFIAEKV